MLRVFCLLLLAFAPVFADVKVGDQAPEITLDKLLPEQPVGNASKSALAGKAVVLEFWATWCGPCVAAIPHLNQLADQFKGRPVVFLSVTDEAADVVQPFLAKRPISGLVGISKALKRTYGVNGIPRTFLIDATGKIAGDVFADQLNAATLEDLLASRPITLKRPAFDFTVKRDSGDGTGPAPLLDILIRPAADTHSSGNSRGRDKWAGKNSSMRNLLASLFEVPMVRVKDEAGLGAARYDFSFSLPGATRDQMKALIKVAVTSALHIDAAPVTTDSDVLLLKAPNGKPAGLVEGPGTGGSSWRSSDRKLEITNGSLAGLADALEAAAGRPVIDETGLAGKFDLKLEFETRDVEGVTAAVRKAGLDLVPARRPVEFLVVKKAE